MKVAHFGAAPTEEQKHLSLLDGAHWKFGWSQRRAFPLSIFLRGNPLDLFRRLLRTKQQDFSILKGTQPKRIPRGNAGRDLERALADSLPDQNPPIARDSNTPLTL